MYELVYLNENEPVHRSTFPSEMVIYIYCDSIDIDILFVDEKMRAGHNAFIGVSPLALNYDDDNKPTYFQISSNPLLENWGIKSARLNEFFFEVTESLITMLKELAKDAALAHNQGAVWYEYVVKFADPADFYRILFKQYQKIADHTGASAVDFGAFLTSWIDWWQQTEGEMDVPGQRAWYENHGPEHGETQQQYDADHRAFLQLIDDNLAALCRLQEESTQM